MTYFPKMNKVVSTLLGKDVGREVYAYVFSTAAETGVVRSAIWTRCVWCRLRCGYCRAQIERHRSQVTSSPRQFAAPRRERLRSQHGRWGGRPSANSP